MPLEIHPEQSKENLSSYTYIKELFAHPIRPNQAQALTRKINRYDQPENPSSQKIILAMALQESSGQYGQLCMVDMDNYVWLILMYPKINYPTSNSSLINILKSLVLKQLNFKVT